VQRIATVGGSKTRPAIGIGGPIDAPAGGAWRLFGSVVVDSGMAMHAGAVIMVVVVVGMRVVVASTLAETHGVRMGVGLVAVRVAMLDETRGNRPDRQPDDDGEGGAANAVRHASTQEADGSVHRTALATRTVAISRSRIWRQAPVVGLPQFASAIAGVRGVSARVRTASRAAENGH
jgi:hypothetical protein